MCVGKERLDLAALSSPTPWASTLGKRKKGGATPPLCSFDVFMSRRTSAKPELTSRDPARAWLGAQVGWGQGTLCPGLAGTSQPVAGGRGGVTRWEVVGGSAHVGTSLRVHGAGVLEVCACGRRWSCVFLSVSCVSVRPGTGVVSRLPGCCSGAGAGCRARGQVMGGGGPSLPGGGADGTEGG